MRKHSLAVLLAIAMMAGSGAFAQTPPKDSAHTVLAPATPDPGRAGQAVLLPRGGTGVTTGGTANYQTLTTPGGSATMVPNGGAGSSVIGSGGVAGTVGAHR